MQFAFTNNITITSAGWMTDTSNERTKAKGGKILSPRWKDTNCVKICGNGARFVAYSTAVRGIMGGIR